MGCFVLFGRKGGREKRTKGRKRKSGNLELLGRDPWARTFTPLAPICLAVQGPLAFTTVPFHHPKKGMVHLISASLPNYSGNHRICSIYGYT